MTRYVSAASLPKPSFIERDPLKVTREWVAGYEYLTGKTIYPAQLERLMANNGAYRESLMREAVQDAALLNLVRFSRSPVLNFIGESLGCFQLDSAPAQATVRFTLDPAPQSAAVLPAGTRVKAGNLLFVTLYDTAIAAAQTYVDAVVECTTAGLAGDGLDLGQINELFAPVDGLNIKTVANITATTGGADVESEERYKERILLAHSQFSVAGPRDAYKYHALSVSTRLLDVGVTRPVDGESGYGLGLVRVWPLYSDVDGTASETPTEVKDAILAALSAEDVRPLCDTIHVLDPEVIDYEIEAELELYAGVDSPATLSLAVAAGAAYQTRLTRTLGNDIVRTQISKELHVGGVYRLNLIKPTQDTVLTDSQWARCTSMQVRVVSTAGEAENG